MWNEASDEEKQPFVDLYQKQKAAYDILMQSFPSEPKTSKAKPKKKASREVVVESSSDEEESNDDDESDDSNDSEDSNTVSDSKAEDLPSQEDDQSIRSLLDEPSSTNSLCSTQPLVEEVN